MGAENLLRIEEVITEACRRCGRRRESVSFIAVSKTKPPEMIREAYEAGQRLFGENKAQEITLKKPLLPPDIQWHFIGNLQRNKVKYLVGEVPLIHSVNSLPLAQEIERIAARRELVQDILVEVNIAEEASKQGIDTQAAGELVLALEMFPHLRLRGLMAVAPYSDDPEDSRPYFRQLRQLKEELSRRLEDPRHFDQLSMGMSGDFAVAIEEGATLIRVGSAIFGARNYG